MKKLVLIGGGGHCKSVIDCISTDMGFEEIVIVDVDENVGKTIRNYPIIGTDDMLNQLYQQGYVYAFITVGSIKSTFNRRKLYERTREIGFEIVNIIDNSAILASDIQLGIGVFVGKRAVINSGVNIGDMAIVNTGAIIEHDCLISDFCHVSVGAILCGNVTVGADSFIGANATVIQGITVSPGCVIGAGLVVRKNL